MANIYLVRHGETDANLMRYYGGDNIDINNVGVMQALNLASELQNIRFDKIYCSPLLRTKHTCDIVLSFQHKVYSVVYDERLKERSCGNLVGHQLSESDRYEYWNYFSDRNFGGEEDVRRFFMRVHNFIIETIEECKNKKYENILIVAHSGISKAFNAYFNGIPDDGNFLNLGIKNTEVKIYNI